MAQEDQRPRHHRQSSRVQKYVNPSDDGKPGRRTAEKRRQNDEATVKYIKRILCAHPAPLGSALETTRSDVDSKPLDSLLPPLTSSNGVDVQLYAIIAVILSQFVQSWYNRLTPDHEFVDEVVQIIAHCTRGFEQRLRSVDLEDILLDELPGLLLEHIDSKYPVLLGISAVATNFTQLSESPKPRAPIEGHQTPFG